MTIRNWGKFGDPQVGDTVQVGVADKPYPEARGTVVEVDLSAAQWRDELAFLVRIDAETRIWYRRNEIILISR